MSSDEIDPIFELQFLSNIAQITLYFSAIGYCFYAIVKRIQLRDVRSLPLLTIALIATILTWNYILMFVIEDWNDKQYIALNWRQTLVQSKRFVKCYATVAGDSSRWLWSSQLLLSVPVLTLYLIQKSATRRLQNVWQIAVIGELTAVSVAIPLAVVLILQSFDQNKEDLQPIARPSMFAYVNVLTAMLLVAVTPFVAHTRRLKSVLFALHIVVLLPTINYLNKRFYLKLNWLSISSVYALLAFIAICSHWITFAASYAFHESVDRVLSQWASAFFSHPCQTSISIDASFTTALIITITA